MIFWIFHRFYSILSVPEGPQRDSVQFGGGDASGASIWGPNVKISISNQKPKVSKALAWAQVRP